ncbi:MAG: hypothetical protein JW829_05000 [Pirellulales bacterium]|nr:hypothetical protein [Pirellulales bacterium]
MNTTLDYQTIAEACRVEHRILGHVKNALRVALNWHVSDVGLPRKISTVRFTFQSFQRHLERLMDLEEEGGFMTSVAECKPNLHHRAEKIRCEHDKLRHAIPELVAKVESISDYSSPHLFREACDEINQLLGRLDQHDHDEITLLQDAFHCDEGGEG